MSREHKLTHKQKLQKLSSSKLIWKISFSSFITILTVVGACLLPNKFITHKFIYEQALQRVCLKDESKDLALVSYKVYVDSESYTKRFYNDMLKKADEFKQNKSILVVKVKGVGKYERHKNFYISYDSNLKDYVVEYYAAKRVKIFDKILPTETLISGGYSLSDKINLYAYPITLSLLLLIGVCVQIPNISRSKELYDRKHKSLYIDNKEMNTNNDLKN